MNYYRHIIKSLAEAFIAGNSTNQEMEERGIEAMGENPPWLRGLCVRLLAHFEGGLSSSKFDELVDFIARDEEFTNAWRRRKRPRIRSYFINPAEMEEPPRALADSGIQPLPDIASIAEWLNISVRRLEWYSDKWNGERRVPDGPMRHYKYRWEPRPDRMPRLIEAPKHRLREIQRRILRNILNKIPPHHSAHGFTKGRSCLTFCRPHVNRRIVLRLDLKDFFPRIRYGRIHGLFRTIGYPRETTRMMTCLCTNRVPDAVLANVPMDHGTSRMPWRERKKYQSPHLPQGAPTSPSIANLCAHRLDLRLKGAAVKAGAIYTRYADDMAFSGGRDFEKGINRFYMFIGRIALEEGFEINTRKTRVMRQGVRQKLTGIVLNKHPNICRKEYDTLKATLYNCIRFGPDTQNRANINDFHAHLAGRISYVKMINPKRARRLTDLFEKIRWD
ncbi:MAG: RNA-directed DNA polymerase [bacterium]|nr:RNA-directed DNA polymerase [bacterium]